MSCSRLFAHVVTVPYWKAVKASLSLSWIAVKALTFACPVTVPDWIPVKASQRSLVLLRSLCLCYSRFQIDCRHGVMPVSESIYAPSHVPSLTNSGPNIVMKNDGAGNEESIYGAMVARMDQWGLVLW